jgi:hypothetical protein
MDGISALMKKTQRILSPSFHIVKKHCYIGSLQPEEGPHQKPAMNLDLQPLRVSHLLGRWSTS